MKIETGQKRFTYFYTYAWITQLHIKRSSLYNFAIPTITLQKVTNTLQIGCLKSVQWVTELYI